MSQPTSSRVAVRQSVKTVRTTVTSAPMPSEMNSRGRIWMMRKSRGISPTGQHLSRVGASSPGSRVTVSRMTGSSVGIDVGGTFTDFVVRAPSGRLSSGKVPTTPANPALGVMHGLTTLVGSAPLASVAHGTTIVTNAIVEGRGAVVGLITTRGFRDVLEIARVSRLHLYDLKPAPKPPAPRPRRRLLH